LAEGILKRKNQTLLITLPESYPDLHADPLLLEHLMSNLIQNASRHSPEHTSIHIKISVYNQNFMEIQVEDRGSGIQPEHRDKIFERFFRSDRNRSREEGGTGLGLSIAKQIVEMHGGSISASNSDQGGAVIRFTLKFNPE
ncbi:MAG: ATP-binding protein, partial [Spirochaetia bacterium]|nr:ATP-binding protein [Spirochaetia bacterium]